MSKYLLCDYPSLKDVECHIKRQRWISCEVAEARIILEHFSEQIVGTYLVQGILFRLMLGSWSGNSDGPRRAHYEFCKYL